MFTLPELPYEYSALEPFIDTQTMQIHHDKHHGTYVKNLNDLLQGNEELLMKEVEDLIASLNDVPEDIRTKVRNNAGGHANHTFFWKIMSPGGGHPDGNILESLEKSFGDIEAFKKEFTKSALGVFGSGWVWVVLNQGTLEIITTANQDSPVTSGKNPILGLDLWEHAYYLKYQNKRADYIDAWWNLVNWEEVNKLYKNSL